MRNTIFNSSIVLIIAVFTASTLPQSIYAQTQTYTIGEPTELTFNDPFQGFGAEWDPFFWNSYNQGQGLNQADWELITGRMKEMDIHLVRMWMQLYYARNYNGDYSQWDFENQRMQSLYKHLDFACQNNIEVALTDWGWSFWYSYNMFNGNPTDPAFTQAIAYYLKELIDNRGYSCIKYIILGNEPDYEIIGAGRQGDTKTFEHYRQMITNLDTSLKANGLRNKLKMIGPDNACCQGLFVNTLQSSLHSTFDIYDFHHYSAESNIFSGTSHVEFQTRRDWIQQYSPDQSDFSKPLWITEAGMTTGVSDSFSHALNMADYGTQLLNSQVQAAIAWNMYDQYYDQGHSETENNAMIPWGMWKYKNNNWAIRPWAQTWGLLVKFAPKGSVRTPIMYPDSSNFTPPFSPGSGTVRVAALKKPDNGWSIFLVNRNISTSTIQVSLPDANTHLFNKHEVTDTTLNTYPDNIIVPPGTVSATSVLTLSLPANSFTVLSEISNLSPTTSPPLPGDTNDDRTVNILDYQILANTFGSTIDLRANFNTDTVVNILDYQILANNFGRTN